TQSERPARRLRRRGEPQLPRVYVLTPTATTGVYTLSLHDALPILVRRRACRPRCRPLLLRRRLSLAVLRPDRLQLRGAAGPVVRWEEHTSELQSQSNLVCRLLIEKKSSEVRIVCLALCIVKAPTVP